MNRLIYILSVLALTLMSGCQQAPRKITVGYIQITQDAVLDAARAGVFLALADSGFVDGENIKVIDNNAQGDLSMINLILQSLVSQNVDIIITNSTPCMVAAAQTVRNIPVVFTVSFGPAQVGLTTTPPNLYGVYDPLKAAEFADLLIECLPNVKRIGIPFNNSEPNAEYSAKVFKQEFANRGISIVTASVTSSNDILQAGQYLAGQQIDAIIVAADNTVYQGIPLLAKLAAENKIPLFVSDALQTEKGAAVGFGVRYDQWGYQSGLMAVEILKGRVPRGNPMQPIVNYDLIINLKACSDQGLIVPDTIIKRASRLIH